MPLGLLTFYLTRSLRGQAQGRRGVRRVNQPRPQAGRTRLAVPGDASVALKVIDSLTAQGVTAWEVNNREVLA